MGQKTTSFAGSVRAFFRRRLRCSFCGRDEHEVAKLVAGPRVLICDDCVATCHALVSEPPRSVAPRP
jgi:ATP-dependent Clp protease ATP-binding subunit ClpX